MGDRKYLLSIRYLNGWCYVDRYGDERDSMLSDDFILTREEADGYMESAVSDHDIFAEIVLEELGDDEPKTIKRCQGSKAERSAFFVFNYFVNSSLQGVQMW